MKRALSLFTVLSLAAVLFSCTREEVEFSPRKSVSFQATLTTDAQTRGIPYGSEKGLEETPFTAWAYTYADEASAKALYKAPVKVTFNSSANLWIPTESYVWPYKEGMIDFYAFAPFDAAELDTDSGKLTYTVPESIPEQRGLMVAGPVVRKDNPTADQALVEIAFQHALAGITFKTGKSVKITEVKVSGICDTGVFDMKTMNWESIDKVTGERIYTISEPGTTEKGDFDVFNAEHTLMLLPQTCPEGALLTVSTDSRTVEIPIEGHVWEQGKLTTYILARDDQEYFLTVDPPKDLDYQGGVVTGIVTSYKYPDGGPQVPEDWEIIGFYPTQEDAENQTNELPDMGFIEKFEKGEPDEDGNYPISVEYGPDEPETVVQHFNELINAELAGSPEKGTPENPWNLANPADGGDFNTETANTYIVGAPGWYRIPMVAGNGVKNNVPNPSAYANNAYFDYKDQVIGSPYLQKTSGEAGTPSKAYVVWEDNPLIDVADETDWFITGTDGGACISATGSGDETVYWLNFHISKDNIHQGLANIAVEDENGTVMWSWFIWVTDYTAAADKAVKSHPDYNKTFTLMSRDLGWVEIGTSTTVTWEEDVVYIRIEQKNKLQGKVQIIEVRRPGHEEFSLDLDGFSPFFQFGRKDPLQPGISAGENGSLPTIGRVPKIVNINNKVTVGTVIQNPGTHFGYGVKSPFDWSETANKTDWWWTGNTASGVITAEAVVKTVYDPCPAGYHVPASAAFTGFTRTGRAAEVGEETFVQSAGEVPTKNDFKNGWWFSVDGEAKSDFIFFPSNGYRNSAKGELVNVGKNGYFWTAMPNGEDYARILEFDPENVYPTKNDGRRSRALTVRPAKDE